MSRRYEIGSDLAVSLWATGLRADALRWNKKVKSDRLGVMKILSEYHQAVRTIVRNRWLWLLPLLAIVLPRIITSHSFWVLNQRQFATLNSTSIWAYFREVSYFFQLGIGSLFIRTHLLDALSKLSIISYVGGIIAIIFFVIKWKYFLKTVKEDRFLMIGLPISLIGLLVGWGWQLVGLLHENYFLPTTVFYLFSISQIIFVSLGIIPLALGIFLSYVRSIVLGDTGDLSSHFERAGSYFLPLSLFSLLLVITGGSFTRNILPPSLPDFVFTLLQILHYAIIVFGIFVPFIIVSGTYNLRSAFWHSIEMFKRPDVWQLVGYTLIVVFLISLLDIFLTPVSFVLGFFGFYGTSVLFEILFISNALLFSVISARKIMISKLEI